MQNMQRYFGFRVTVSDFLEPQDVRVIQDKITNLAAGGKIDLTKYKIYLHQLSLAADSSHFGVAGGLKGRLSSISLRFSVNQKQRQSGEIQFANHLFDEDIREEVVHRYLQSEIFYKIPVERFERSGVFQNILIALVRVGLREDYRKIKVSVSVVPTNEMVRRLHNPENAAAQTILPLNFEKALAFNRQTRLFDQSAASAPSPIDGPKWVEEMQFKVALSYPGTQSQFVSSIARSLKSRLGNGSVFFDKDFTAQLARPNLDSLLQKIYLERSDLVVVFLCASYQESKWCGIEWRAIKEIINRCADRSIMFMRFDDAAIPGIVSGDGWIDLRKIKPQVAADYIYERVVLNESATRNRRNAD